MLEWLNNYAGLFSLLAVLAAILVPCFIYKRQRNDERQAMKDELDSIREHERFPMSVEEREYCAKRSTLEKGLRRK